MIFARHAFSISISFIFIIIGCGAQCPNPDIYHPEAKCVDSIRNGPNDNGRWYYKFENIAVYAMKGSKTRWMEDNYRVMLLENTIKASLLSFGVFDGHGGPKASEFAADRLNPSIIDDYYKERQNEWSAEFMDPVRDYFEGGLFDAKIDRLKRRIGRTVKAVDKELLKNVGTLIPKDAGSTAMVGLLDGPMFYNANAGDSRALAVKIRPARFDTLSVDHRPYLRDDKQRIEMNGGTVSRKGTDLDLTAEYGGYSTKISRSLGDKFLKDNGIVIAKPFVNFTNLIRAKYDYAILATKGFWNAMSEKDAIEIVNRNVEQYLYGARQLAEAARKKTDDDVTVMVVGTRYTPPDPKSKHPHPHYDVGSIKSTSQTAVPGGSASNIPTGRDSYAADRTASTPAGFASVRRSGDGKSTSAHFEVHVPSSKKATVHMSYTASTSKTASASGNSGGDAQDRNGPSKGTDGYTGPLSFDDLRQRMEAIGMDELRQRIAKINSKEKSTTSDAKPDGATTMNGGATVKLNGPKPTNGGNRPSSSSTSEQDVAAAATHRNGAPKISNKGSQPGRDTVKVTNPAMKPTGLTSGLAWTIGNTDAQTKTHPAATSNSPVRTSGPPSPPSSPPSPPSSPKSTQ